MPVSVTENPGSQAGSNHHKISELPYVALGDASLAPDIDTHIHVDASTQGLLLLGPVDTAELDRMLDAAPDPALPVADLGGNRAIRTDFTGDPARPGVFDDVRAAFAPIQQRLAALPFRAAREDRAELTILRLAYSRNAQIAAAFNPNSRTLVEYPLLGRAGAYRQRLEGLANLGLLRRQHFTRTHLCGRCESARLHAFECCGNCGSSDLMESSILHHYQCGWQASETAFLQDGLLICPKCHRELRHYGVDYDRPGTVLVCRGCQHSSSEPDVKFSCMDCGYTASGDNVRTLDWHHYDLTEEGLRALRDGQIPRFDLRSHLEAFPRAFIPRDFWLLARESIRVARRYDRPFSIGALSFTNVRALRQKYGPVAEVEFSKAVDAVVEGLRDCDFVGVDNQDVIYAGLPETNQKDATMVFNRITEKIQKSTSLPIEIAIAVADGDNAEDLLPRDEGP